MDKIMRLLKRLSGKETAERFNQLQQGLDHQADVVNRELGEIVKKIEVQSNLLNRKFEELERRLEEPARGLVELRRKLEEVAGQLSGDADARSLVGERTYNGTRFSR
jgi:hypothetical protein